MFSLGVYYWMPENRPGFRAGRFVADPLTGRLDIGPATRANGFMLTIPTGGFNRLEVGYWRAFGAGDVRAPNRLAIFGAGVANRELMNTEFRLTNLRLAWNYLTYPVPPFDAKLRVKSFWEFQFTEMRPTLRFPEARGAPPPLTRDQSVKYPGVGLGLEYIPSKHFRLEGRGSGMAFPGRSGYWDIEANAVARIKKVEIFGGYKGFHFHTSRKKEETIMQGTLWGPSFGIRYVFW